MSDTDDGFDEEAVREELRQKYEDEREDREATARMSELLLQGATMTNQHCDRCGTPVFRYDGESFCPDCQHEAEQAQTREQAEGGQRDAHAEQSANGRAADEQAADAPTADEAATSEAPAAARTGDRRAPSSESGGQHAPETRDQRRSRDVVAERAQEPQSERPGRSGGTAPSGEAADALESAIAALARRAAAADDPRTAREHLEAAREAAEALAALREPGRN